MNFDVYAIDNAPQESRPTLEAVKQAYGFVPNLFGVFAESPAAAAAYAAIGQAHTNHIAETPLDEAFAAQAWQDERSA